MDKSTIILIVVAFSIGFALMFFDNPLKTWLTPKVEPVTQWMGQAVNQKVDAITADPWTFAIAAAVPTITVFGLAAKAYSSWKAKSQAALEASQQSEQQAQTNLSAVLQENVDLKEEIAVANKDGPNAQSLKEIIAEKDAEIRSLNAQLNDITTRYNTLKHDFDQLSKLLRPDPDAQLRKTA